jgi:hypothetical protein
VIIKSLVPSLATLALYALYSPTAAAVTVSDSDWSLSVGGIIQARVDVSKAKDDAGNDYNIDTASDFSKSDTADFYLRRARVSFKGTYKEDTGFNLTLRGDGAGHPANSTTAKGVGGSDASTPNGTTGTTGGVFIHQAFIYQKFHNQDNTVVQQAQIGIDYAWHNRQPNVISSADMLLPNFAMPAHLLNNRAAGVGYRLNTELVSFGADIQDNNAEEGSTSNTAAAPNKSQGLFYSARVEITGPGSLRIAKDTETFLGKEGMGFRVGADVADNVDARTGGAPAAGTVGNPAPNTDTSTIDYGIDALFHFDGLSALAESRWDIVKAKPDLSTTPSTTTHKQAFNIQAGYAMPLATYIIEPAVRYERADFKDAPGTSYGLNDFNDYGNSGKQFDIGVNMYWAGTKSKTSLEYSNWKSLYPGATAATGSKADASIFRLQQQLVF